MTEQIISISKQLHSTSAGLKGFSTEAARDGLEVLRMSCGGHGFSAASAFPEIYGVFAPSCTYEGENTVMLLQTARLGLPCFSKLKVGRIFWRLICGEVASSASF